MSLTEEKFQELLGVLGVIATMQENMYESKLRNEALLNAITHMIERINYVGGEVYKFDSANTPIQRKINTIYEEIRPLYTENRDVEEFPAYIERAQKHISEIRAYLIGKRDEKKGQADGK